MSLGVLKREFSMPARIPKTKAISKRSRKILDDKFKIPEELRLLKGIQKRREYGTVEDFQRLVVDKFNQLHPGKVLYSFQKTPTYVKLQCNQCKTFQIWFTYRLDEAGTICDIEYSRVIN